MFLYSGEPESLERGGLVNRVSAGYFRRDSGTSRSLLITGFSVVE